MVLQCGRGDNRTMRFVQDAMGKGNGWVKPMASYTHIAVLPVLPVNLHPVNKPITGTAADIC